MKTVLGHDAALWSNYDHYDVGMLNKLLSCYNRCLKIFFGFSHRDSLTYILGLPSFDMMMTNAAVSYSRLWNSCSNCIVMRLRQLSLLSV